LPLLKKSISLPSHRVCAPAQVAHRYQLTSHRDVQMNTDTIQLAGRTFSYRSNMVPGIKPGIPLIVAIHGGGYTSEYFGVKGFSMLDRAAALGMPVVAIDRPGYGKSEVRDEAELSHARTAELLALAIGDLWASRGGTTAGIVLVGHSIGGAITSMIAARRPEWPLLGIAVSGFGLRTAPGDAEAWNALPPGPFVDLPIELRDSKMFGPPGTYDDTTPATTHRAYAPMARQELVDIVTAWPLHVRSILSQIRVPVHYRQADGDALWTVSAQEVQGFASACASASWTDAALVRGSGHCIDFHYLGGSFQTEQLAFALKCAAYATMSSLGDAPADFAA
jgi:pimeloyl-ACP methyl ester carboxylesterase